MPSLTKVQTGFLEAVNPLTLASGTASVPIISFSNSAATGIFSPYTGALGFSSGSTQNALTIIPDGKVGIGTTNPLYNTHIYGSVNGIVSLVVANKLNDVSSRAFFALENDTGGQGSLHFTGSTFANTGYARPSCLALYTSGANSSGGIAIAARNTSGYIDFYTGGGNQRAIITSTGNVGIGTTNASSILHLYGAGQNIILDNSTSASVSGLKIRFQSNDSHGTQILYDPNAAITYFDNTYPVSTGTVYGDIRFRQNVSGTSTARLVIKGDGGNIGIGGITNPAFAIDAGNATSNKAFRIGGLIGGNSGNSYAGIGYNAAPNGPNTWQYDTTDSSSWIQFNAGSHVFYRAASGTAGNSITPLESARFDNSGNVGIGTNNPGTKLDVYGDIAINGTFALRRKDYGYSAIYKNVFIGSPDSVANTVSLCVDVSTISGGNFHGQNQVIIPRQGLLVPNNAGTNFVGVLSRDSNDYIRIGPDAPGGISGGPITVATSSVGIGTTNPGSKLVLAGFGANNTLRFADGAFEADIGYVDNTGNLTIQNWNDIIFRTGSSTRTEKVRILSSGNVGIGTTNPSTKLHVEGGVLTTGLTVSSGTRTVTIGDYPNVNGELPTPAILVATSGSYPLSLIGDAASGSTSGGIVASYYSSQNGWRRAIEIFNTTSATGNLLLMKTGGNVGIGTNNPTQGKLDVRGTIASYGSGVNSYSTDFATYVVDYSRGGFSVWPGLESGRWMTHYGAFVTAGNAGARIYSYQNGSINATICDLHPSGSTIFSNTTIQGSLSKSSGSFKINHPLPEKTETHYLVHSFVESPQANNIYRGKVTLVNGYATVNLDEVSGMTEGTFVLLNRDIHCFTSNETDWDNVKGSVTENILTIVCQNENSSATVSWLVIGERHDKHMYDTEWTDDNGKVIVEPLKTLDINSEP